MMLRRILLKPSGVVMRKIRSIGYNKEEISNFSRLTMTIKPKGPFQFMYFVMTGKNAMPYHAVKDHMAQVANNLGDTTNNYTINMSFKKEDLDDKGQLKLRIMMVKYCKTVEIIPITIDTTKQKDVIPWQNGQTDVDIFTRIEQKPDVVFRDANQLCRREEEFVTKRKRFVYNNMIQNMNLKTSLEGKDDSVVPRIAIIGSGGGLRAVIGMSSAVLILKRLGILDYTMYTAGINGSLWYLMALYGFGKKLDPEKVHARIRLQLSKYRTIHILKYNYDLWMGQEVHSIHSWLQLFNLKNESYIGKLILEKQFMSKWSEQTKKLERGKAPLPFLAALHVHEEKGINDYHEWIEMSPYEVFIPNYCAAIDMKNFGDEFNGGFVIKKANRDTIGILQGICCNGHAEVKNDKTSGVKWYQPWSVVSDWICFQFNYIHKHAFGKVPNWLRGIPSVRPLSDDKDSKTDTFDVRSKEIHLVDAIHAFSSPYPSVLHPSRKVDVIISFDFSDRGKDTNWPFDELEKASEWAKKRQIAFPNIKSKLQEIRNESFKKGDYKEVYVFPGGDDSPTIVHFVLIDNSVSYFGKPWTPDFRIFPDYATTKFHYSTEEFDNLSTLIMTMVEMNQKKILDCILSRIGKRK